MLPVYSLVGLLAFDLRIGANDLVYNEINCGSLRFVSGGFGLVRVFWRQVSSEGICRDFLVLTLSFNDQYLVPNEILPLALREAKVLLCCLKVDRALARQQRGVAFPLLARSRLGAVLFWHIGIDGRIRRFLYRRDRVPPVLSCSRSFRFGRRASAGNTREVLESFLPELRDELIQGLLGDPGEASMPFAQFSLGHPLGCAVLRPSFAFILLQFPRCVHLREDTQPHPCRLHCFRGEPLREIVGPPDCFVWLRAMRSQNTPDRKSVV